LWVLSFFSIIVGGLFSVAFITLIERKVLSFSQIRLGPNKVSLLGILQPIVDGVKLLFKKNLLLVTKQMRVYFGPIILFFLFLVVWSLLPWFFFFLSFKFSLVVFFFLIAFVSYGVILVGWGSIRIFSKLGRTRRILQALSLEISLVVFFLIAFSFNSSLGFIIEGGIIIIILIWTLILIFLSLADCNRAPIDLLEGERELIRGFNIEVGRILFVFIFLSEYGIMIFFSLLSGVSIFWKKRLRIFLIFSFMFLFLRSCFPRIRYDQLLYFIWKDFLLISLYLLIFFKV
jgi:NADH:ubiquinone oxidoreductase subunit H